VSQARSNRKLAAYMWKCVNSVIGRDKSHTAGLPQGVSLDVINDFFQSVAISSQHLPAEDYNVSSSESISDQFMFDKIDSSTVFAQLSSLDVRKSTGPDIYLLDF